MKKYSIYLLTSLDTGLFYIGCSYKPEDRWCNGLGYRDNKRLDNDISKYGWNNFHTQILWSTDSMYDAAIMEAFLIKWTDSCDPSVGYNNSMYIQDILLYGGIPATAYREDRAWDILSEMDRDSRLLLFLKEREILPDEWFN